MLNQIEDNEDIQHHYIENFNQKIIFTSLFYLEQKI
jgi:hypothetical protein